MTAELTSVVTSATPIFAAIRQAYEHRSLISPAGSLAH